MRAFSQFLSCAIWSSVLFVAQPLTAFSPSAAFRPLQTTTTITSKHCASLRSNDDQAPIVIALTREEGKNEKLRKQLTQALQECHQLDKVEIVELPCIAHADGPDYDQLKETLQDQSWDYVTITSPEAARVLASAWKPDSFSHSLPAVAAVGKATERALEQAGIPVAFCPSKATAKVLVQELPNISKESDGNGEPTTVLYPASAKAATTLQDGLTTRGFAVTRLNTYDTVTATWTKEQQHVGQRTKIVCVASPSSIRGWLANNNKSSGNSDDGIDKSILAACIGETSAKACRELGFSEEQIFYPDQPGIPGWVETIQEAMNSLSNNHSRANPTIMTTAER